MNPVTTNQFFCHCAAHLGNFGASAALKVFQHATSDFWA